MDEQDTTSNEPGEPPSEDPKPTNPGGRLRPAPGGSHPCDVTTATLDVIDPRGLLDTDALAWVRARGRDALAALGLPGEVRARLVDDDEMSREHEAHLGDPTTTDVMTFDLAEAPGTLDADLLVCVDEAARQASARGHAVEREVLLYIVHGVLHCAGENDTDEASSARMHAREDELLEAAGVGPVYAPKGGSR